MRNCETDGKLSNTACIYEVYYKIPEYIGGVLKIFNNDRGERCRVLGWLVVTWYTSRKLE